MKKTQFSEPQRNPCFFQEITNPIDDNSEESPMPTTSEHGELGSSDVDFCETRVLNADDAMGDDLSLEKD